MSQRGSFVTEYIDCGDCFAVARSLLCGDDKFLRGVAIPKWTDGLRAQLEPLPIIAGKVGGPGAGEELIAFEYDLGPKLCARLCHPLRVAVLAEGCDGRVFTFEPKARR